VRATEYYSGGLLRTSPHHSTRKAGIENQPLAVERRGQIEVLLSGRLLVETESGRVAQWTCKPVTKAAQARANKIKEIKILLG
jgi:hypothetical protein